MSIDISVSSLAGRSQYTVEDGTTAADLRTDGIVAEGCGLRQAGLPVADDTVLVDGGNYVTTPPAAKHGSGDITITVASLAGRQEYVVPEGTTAADLFAQNIVGDGCGLRQAGQPIPNGTVLVNGGTYVTTPPAAKHGA
jgi:hypothetical protein